MLRINLLPPYVFDKQKKMQVWAIWGIVVLMLIGVFAFANKSAAEKQEAAQAENDEAKKQQGLYDALAGKITKENDRIAETKKKQDFIADAKYYNDRWPELYRMMRDVTSSRVILRRMELTSPTTMNVSAWAPDEKTAAAWWQSFRAHYTGPKGIFETVGFDLPKNSFPPGVDDKGGSAGSPYSGFGGRGPASNPGGFGGGGATSPSAIARPATSPYSGFTPYGGGGGAAGGATDYGGLNTTGGKDDEVGPGSVEDRLGIFFRVHAVLKTPFAAGKPAPVWGAVADPNANPAGLAAPSAPPRSAPAAGGGSAGGDDADTTTTKRGKRSKADSGE